MLDSALSCTTQTVYRHVLSDYVQDWKLNRIWSQVCIVLRITAVQHTANSHSAGTVLLEAHCLVLLSS
jgi:hypothetical protein